MLPSSWWRCYLLALVNIYSGVCALLEAGLYQEGVEWMTSGLREREHESGRMRI